MYEKLAKVLRGGAVKDLCWGWRPHNTQPPELLLREGVKGGACTAAF